MSLRLVSAEEEAVQQARNSGFVSSTFEVYHRPSCFHVAGSRWGVYDVPKEMLAEMRACTACGPDVREL